MRERVNQIPLDQFVAAWNAATTLADAGARMTAIVGKSVPGWAALSRAAELRKGGIELQRLSPPPSRSSAPATDAIATN